MLIVKTSKYPIGLDISDTSIKAVQLNKSRERITIQALSKMELPEGVVIDGEIKNSEVLAKNINVLLLKPRYGNFTSRDIVASLPDSKTYIEIIGIEDSPNNIKDLIANEIENHIPVPLNELCYDFQIINRKRDLSEVLVGGASYSLVNKYLAVLDACKLNVIAFETESIANARALLKEESPKSGSENHVNYALTNIGSKKASMAVYAKKSIIFAVSMPISSFEVTEKIAKALEITKEQAEKAKLICGLDDTKAQGIISEILTDNIKNLNDKTSDAINFYEKHYGNYGSLTKIILCGGGAAIKDLENKISKSCNIETIMGNISINLSGIEKISEKIFTETHNIDSNIINNPNNDNISSKQNSSLSYATPIGSALRNIYLEQ